MRLAPSRLYALLIAAVLVFASALATSPPAAARALYVRHCSWSYGYHHCHYQRYSPRHRYYRHRHYYRHYPYHRHYYRHYHRYPYCYYHRCYYHRPGWNNRY